MKHAASELSPKMKLRSGRNTTGHCRTCDIYHGNPNWNYECSTCTSEFNAPRARWYNPQFRDEVNDWAAARLAPKKFVRILRKVVSVACFHDRDSVNSLKRLIQELRDTNGGTLYISASEGEQLLRRTGAADCPEKSNVICPLVVDWWNMKNLDYKSYELCYYGRYGEPEQHITSIPPPPPICL